MCNYQENLTIRYINHIYHMVAINALLVLSSEKIVSLPEEIPTFM